MNEDIIICKGLPGSGKTTWAMEQVREHGYKRVNKDDLRAMVDGGRHSSGNEKTILALRDQIIMTALARGHRIIVDDTNLHPKHQTQIETLSHQFGEAHGDPISVGVKDFTDVLPEQCIENDLKRPNSVGSQVIMGMFDRYLADKFRVEQDESLPRCAVVDIDGTVAKMHDRGPFEWDKVGNDLPHVDVIDLLIAMENQEFVPDFVYVSGRDESCRIQTMQWIRAHGLPGGKLFMRPAGSMEKDYVVKERIFRQDIMPRWYVEMVFDDRNQTVNMWRRLGLRCLQVAPGNF